MRTISLKLVRLVLTLLLVTFFTTILLDFVPGDPAYEIAGPGATQEDIDRLNAEFGFDEPFLERYVDWLGSIARGEFGTSFSTRQPVWDAIVERIPVTLELAGLATLLSIAIAGPLAVLCAQRAGGRFDRSVRALTFAQISVPGFVTALILSYLFSVRWSIFPVLGWVPLTESVTGNLKSVALPVLTIVIVEVVTLQRVLRADLVDTLQEDYIALARAKGLSPRTIMWKHALKPSSFSLITLSALSFARLLGGTVVVESIFVLPGLGSLLLQAIGFKDLFMVQGVVVFIAIAFVLINFAVDLLYGVLDPRVRVRQASA